MFQILADRPGCHPNCQLIAIPCDRLMFGLSFYRTLEPSTVVLLVFEVDQEVEPLLACHSAEKTLVGSQSVGTIAVILISHLRMNELCKPVNGIS